MPTPILIAYAHVSVKLLFREFNFHGSTYQILSLQVLLGLFLSVRQTTPSTCFPDRLTLFENTTPVVFTSRIELNETIMFMVINMMSCILIYSCKVNPQILCSEACGVICELFQISNNLA